MPTLIRPWSRSKSRQLPCADVAASLGVLAPLRIDQSFASGSVDSLYLTAGIMKSQVAKLEAAGIDTMCSLSKHEERVPKLADATVDKLRIQAQLQHARKTGKPAFALRPRVPGKGFNLLPRSDPGDLFYDIEGDPFYSEASTDSLEYLQGVWDGEEFVALWSHDLAEERKR